MYTSFPFIAMLLYFPLYGSTPVYGWMDGWIQESVCHIYHTRTSEIGASLAYHVWSVDFEPRLLRRKDSSPLGQSHHCAWQSLAPLLLLLLVMGQASYAHISITCLLTTVCLCFSCCQNDSASSIPKKNTGVTVSPVYPSVVDWKTTIGSAQCKSSSPLSSFIR